MCIDSLTYALLSLPLTLSLRLQQIKVKFPLGVLLSYKMLNCFDHFIVSPFYDRVIMSLSQNTPIKSKPQVSGSNYSSCTESLVRGNFVSL